MIPPPIPPDEERRLQALRSLRILDTPPEERFDRITRITRYLLGVPIALVSLVDRARQWFKSRDGMDATQTSREISFCGHAILRPELLEVPDASLDPRFRDNPLVAGDPKIRFYAGRPLAAPDGSRVGTLCAIDRRPKTLTAEERIALDDLAAMVEGELAKVELAEALERVRVQEEQIRDFLENANDLIQSVDREGRFLYANRKWHESLGYPREDLPRLRMFDIIHPESRDHCAGIYQRLRPGDRVDGVEATFRTRDGRSILVSGNVSCSEDPVRGFFTRGIFRDVTDRRRAEEALHRLATTDGLTGLWNGAHFRARLAEEIARSRRSGSALSLAMIDLDHFKEINDTHGHDAGDAALVRVSRTLKDRLRGTDLVGRYGGDELCALLLGTGAEEAGRILTEIGQGIAAEELRSSRGEPFRVRCSIGVAGLDPAIADAAGFFKRADEALYAAKLAGRNRVVVAT